MSKATLEKPAKFKVGDIVKPIHGKKTSNNHLLKDFLKAEVMKVNRSSYGKRVLTIKLIEVPKKPSYHWYIPNREINIFEDAFELWAQGEPEYDIY